MLVLVRVRVLGARGELFSRPVGSFLGAGYARRAGTLSLQSPATPLEDCSPVKLAPRGWLPRRTETFPAKVSGPDDRGRELCTQLRTIIIKVYITLCLYTQIILIASEISLDERYQ